MEKCLEISHSKTIYLVNVKVVNDGVEARVQVVQKSHHLRNGQTVSYYGYSVTVYESDLHSNVFTCMGVLSADRAVKPTISLK